MRDYGHYGRKAFLEAFNRADPPTESVLREDRIRAVAIMGAYDDARFDYVDCLIMAMCERLDITRIATFDRRDFSIFRPTHCDYLELVP